jgi:hypothetical protein
MIPSIMPGCVIALFDLNKCGERSAVPVGFAYDAL